MIIKVRNSELKDSPCSDIVVCKNMKDLSDWLNHRAAHKLPISGLTFFDRNMKPLGERVRQVLSDTYIVEWPIQNSYMTKCVFVNGVAK